MYKPATTSHSRRRRWGCGTSIAVILTALSAQLKADPVTAGAWSDLQHWPVPAIHASVLPSGEVLFWGRREWGADKPLPNPNTQESSLDVHDCVPRLWNPSTGEIRETHNRPGYNLFCSGHAFLPDGKLFVAGGHLHDGEGVDRASVYDYQADEWKEVARMPDGGRWYPTCLTLPDGSVLVASGSSKPNQMTTKLEVWRENGSTQWAERGDYRDIPYYPRMHVALDGTVFMSGAQPLTQFQDSQSNWTFLVPGDFAKSSRKNGYREYAPSVLYDSNKVIFIGGRAAPIAACEVADLSNRSNGWTDTDPMRFARTHHNATLLPDGTVLVTGGTQGDDGPTNGFNDVRQGQPIHAAELWNPRTGHWTTLAEEAEDRCYHSIAVLLPDATVLSAGGGEYRMPDGSDNDPAETKRTAQVFSPPYLFGSSSRPAIAAVNGTIKYGQRFQVELADPGVIAQVTWVRLSSVTHAFNSNQRINFLPFTQNGQSLDVAAPADANACPPGHYMMFVIGQLGKPSVAKIVQIGSP